MVRDARRARRGRACCRSYVLVYWSLNVRVFASDFHPYNLICLTSMYYRAAVLCALSAIYCIASAFLHLLALIMPSIHHMLLRTCLMVLQSHSSTLSRLQSADVPIVYKI